MKRKNQLKRLLTQFSYDHKKLDGQLARVRKSADELTGLLDKMSSDKGKEDKNKKK